jgi:hypothetical protein
LAPANFSCVRPNAATPITAPMAMWNNPAPCNVMGFHCWPTDPLCTALMTLHSTGNNTKSMVQTNMYIQPIMGRHLAFIQSSFFCSLLLTSLICLAPG